MGLEMDCPDEAAASHSSRSQLEVHWCVSRHAMHLELSRSGRTMRNYKAVTELISLCGFVRDLLGH